MALTRVTCPGRGKGHSDERYTPRWSVRSPVNQKEAIATKVSASRSGVVIPSLIAGVIYVVVALATGAPAVVAIAVGIVVAAAAAAVGLVFREINRRRGA